MKYRVIVLVLSAVVAVLVHFPELVSMFQFSAEFNPFGHIGVAEVASEVGYLFLSLLLLFWLNAVVFKFHNTQRKIRWQWLVLSFFATWLLSSAMAHLFILMREYLHIPAINVTLHHYLHPLRDSIISCVVTGGSYIIYLISRQQAIVVENQLLRAENLENQYQSLKNQLNPHMFFNSLNTLNSLIRESPAKAQSYTCELSKVLRYTLHTSKPKGVSLAQELEFVHAYIYLLQTRYEENLNFHIEIDNQLLEHALPPMAIQLLIENAVKHNEISTKNPMHLTIRTVGPTIEVCNPIQPKLSAEHSAGIGLDNLQKRYELLFKQSIAVCTENGVYCVTLPLIPPIDEGTTD